MADKADEVLARQAKTRADRTGEPFEDALKAVMGTEAGRQLGEVRNGPHHEERAQEWQERLARERTEEHADALVLVEQSPWLPCGRLTARLGISASARGSAPVPKA